MKSYIVYEPKGGAARSQDGADSLVFVREGFSWLAFLLPLPWLLWHRAWLGLLVWVVGMIGVTAASMLEVGEFADFLLSALVGAVIGFEAAWFRGRSLVRRGYRPIGFAAGNSRAEAETAFFGKWLAAAPDDAGMLPSRPVSATTPSAVFARRDTPVLGVFPLPEGRR